jgi:hypothetical protein
VANKIIKHEDLFEPKITKGIIKELDDLVKKGNETEDALKDILKVLQSIGSIKTAEEFKEFTEESEKLNKAQKELIDTEKKLAKVQEKIIADIEKQAAANRKLSKTEADRIKLTKRLKEANSSAIEDNEIIKVQLQEQNKINKRRAKEALNLISAYEKESKKLNDLRKKYKDLAVQNKENTKEGKKLLKNITELDKKLKGVDETVGQNQRSVGDYKKAVKGLNSTLGKLGIVAIIAKGFELLSSAFGDTREGAVDLQIAVAEVSERIKVVVNNIVKAIPAVFEVFTALGDALSKVFVKAQIAFLELQLSFSALLSGDAVSKIENDIANLNKELTELEKSSFGDALSEAISKIGGAFDDTLKTGQRAVEAQREYLNLQLKIKVSIEQQERALAGLAEKRQILQDISDDDTIGFVTRAEAVKKANKAAVEFANLEARLARTKEKLTIEAVKQDLRRANVLDEADLARIKTGEQLKIVLLDLDKAKKVSDTNDEAFSAAFIERRDKQAEAEGFARDAEEKFRKTARDAFEQELDIYEEFTEKRISNNEKIISSDSASLEERQRALQENRKLEKDLFEESINLIIEQGKASIDLRKKLTDSEKEQQKALLNTEAIKEITNAQDEQEIFNLIRKLDLGEIEEKRLKETLKIRQETAQINKESAAIEEETLLKTKELKEEISIQNRVLLGEEVKLEDERLELQKTSLQTRIDLLKGDSIERLELQKELNDLLIEEEKNKNTEEDRLRKKQAEKDEKEAERQQELINQIVASTIDGINKRNEAENKRLSGQVQSQESSLSIQEQRAKDGLSNTLAFEQQELDKARLRQQQELERQAKQQEIIALVQAYYNQFQSLSSNPETADTAAIKAFTNTLLAKSIAKGLTGFIEGTELVERDMQGSKFSSGQDGYLAKFDGKERILNPAQNMALPKGMTNRELVKAAQDYASGNTWGFMPTVSQTTDSGATTKAIIASNNKVIKAIENNAASMSVDSEGLMHLVEKRVSRGKKELIHFINKKYKMLPK